MTEPRSTLPGTIASRYCALRQSIPEGVTLVAVSKFHPLEAVLEAYAAGCRTFGENRVQELDRKVNELRQKGPQAAPGLQWHFLGHLQRNKVRQLMRCAPDMIESVDSETLLRSIDAAALAQGRVQKVLMQVHVAAEETKFGFLPSELLDFFRAGGYTTLRATHICGVMGMASNTPDEHCRISSDFRAIRQTFEEVHALCPDLRGFDTISMGMSHDYSLAIAEGSTEVRVGTAIFGPREY